MHEPWIPHPGLGGRGGGGGGGGGTIGIALEWVGQKHCTSPHLGILIGLGFNVINQYALLSGNRLKSKDPAI